MNARQRKLAGAVAFAFVIALLAWRLLPSQEPAYNGKTLSAWAEQYGSNFWAGVNDEAARKEAEIAIRQIGTNAIPYLLDLIRVRDSVVKKKLGAVIPWTWHHGLHLTDNSQRIRIYGAHGFGALGTNATSALVELIEVATHHPDEDGRYAAVVAMWFMGAAAEPAIPFLIRCLTNEVPRIRSTAVFGLGHMQRQPEIIVPILIRHLEFAKVSSYEGEHEGEQLAAIQSLAQFGTNAKPARLLISFFLTNQNQFTRMFATNALLKIDAETTATNR
jgi:HEAT repeat protein